MAEFHITVWARKLQQPDPEARLSAIRELEIMGDVRALPLLAEVFATEGLPEVRAAAQQAGKVIYFQALRREQTSQGASPAERRRAAEILQRAQQHKHNRPR
ncbi:MAG: HEAT repeat domain-containing protein [Anaerolineales bacterium]